MGSFMDFFNTQVNLQSSSPVGSSPSFTTESRKRKQGGKDESDAPKRFSLETGVSLEAEASLDATEEPSKSIGI